MKSSKIYICDTYFHILCSIAKAINHKDCYIDLVITNNVIDYSNIFKKIVKSKVFRTVFMLDNKNPTSFPKSKIINKIFNGLYAKKDFKKRLSFNLKKYDEIYLYNDCTFFSKYLKNARIKYNIIEDGVLFYQEFRNRPYPYYKKNIKQKILDIIFPFNINHYNYHDKCRLVKSIEVDHIEGVQLDNIDKIVVSPKQKLFKQLIVENNKKQIFKIFDLNVLINIKGKNNIMIFGNCLAGDKILNYKVIKTQFDKVKNIFNNHQIYFKPHPRETNKYFLKNATILNSFFPSELIYLFFDNKFRKYISFGTSATFLFPQKKVINIDKF